MMAWMRRTVTFARFALAEYVRSGRILVEAATLIAVVWVIFWPRGTTGLDLHQFFVLGSLYILAQAAYTTAALIGLGSRPRGYVLLARSPARSSYLLGLLLAGLAVVISAYLVFSLLLVTLYRLKGMPATLTLNEWLPGSLPLLLNVVIVSTVIALMTPLVLPKIARLLLLGIIALGLSTDFDAGRQNSVLELLRPIRVVFYVIVLPAARGLDLSIQRHYDAVALYTLLGQTVLASVLLALALLAFRRRDLIFR